MPAPDSDQNVSRSDPWSASFWKGRRVLVTGHTGFIGGWLSLALLELGAEVHGLALPPPSEPSLFAAAGMEGRMAHRIADLRDLDATRQAVRDAAPEIVFHLAAQPIVRQARQQPVESFATNVMGTVHLLEALRETDSVRGLVAFTTDKVYRNREWHWAYRESDALGGVEPYGASKVGTEQALDAYRSSYFRGARRLAVATIRAGNVVGGGDWAADRLVPDAMRAFAAGETLVIRRPHSVRPWQHVLEAVGAALLLGRLTLEQPDLADQAWNFGPRAEDRQPVGWIANRLAAAWPGGSWRHEPDEGGYEAVLLAVSSDKARSLLGWAPRWTVAQAIDRSVDWYRRWYEGEDAADLVRQQLRAYGIPGD
ncbi:MAG: CDP-glucose 4,6-dehydratase [Oceanibaculum nanhaiense]|uniref:CDP-glucose 4,6-dehydratase n=1 Tax=Oceanibaculum nanhaiense TaxID=1909734 RepID=UPI0025A43498|nr:CDP-glucose 4,6-dehydratase [Oceanibaculum nanhaiense]MDM7947739.1 CDP-glucose 4,6-dehydratase [Oceanibaculum nanhaiense]